jgi:5'-3' exonuclease
VLLYVYKLVFPTLGGYLVEPGRINFDRLAVFLSELTRLESHFMVRRYSSDDEKKVRQESRAAALAAGLPDPTINPDGTPVVVKSTPDMYAPLISTSEGALWKQRYYKDTFNQTVLEQTFVDGVATNFVEGLFWVYTYYYYGVDQSSWSWFFPHHFAPLLCDVHRVLTTNFKGKDSVKLDAGAPLRPLEQLLAVLPPDSASVLPEAFRHLVQSPSSPIIDYYPEDFEVVLEAGRPSWLAISILNFIDIGRLLKAAAEAEDKLLPEEKIRNTFACHGPAQFPQHH